ncbi:hypothetical protein NXG04_07935 [Klebsiella pneumoniae]|nr:hypothetical protein [Klebsiella pneumoniae]MDS7714485.1 hypothetical protein [Klebsiella pneumoniae]
MSAHNFKDLTSQKFGKLFVIRRTEKPSHIKTKNAVFWLCLCDCGNEKVVNGINLKSGATSSCGCIHKKQLIERSTSHGDSRERLYRIWNGMVNRCTNKKVKDYNEYGGRGISACDEWLSYENFKKDMYESYLEHVSIHGERNTTIDRIESNGNYSKENCRWANWKEQQRNKRNTVIINEVINGKTYTSIMDIAKDYEINQRTIRYRYNKGIKGSDLIKEVRKK